MEKNVMTCDETEALSALAILERGRSINLKRRPCQGGRGREGAESGRLTALRGRRMSVRKRKQR